MTVVRTSLIALALTTALCPPLAAQTLAPAPAVLPTTSYTLPNGLKVIFHIDRSDPVVSVVLAAHVGSSRETAGRTGFAHMFEHLFFLNSENLGPGGLDKLSARVGGTGANGSTSRDWTVYNQEVPKDALEKMIWAEADKLGFFINTVTPAVLEKEKQVVKNEKRQSVDNRAYGHVNDILGRALYPADHPYSWQVIGTMADLDAAQLEDVRAFYRRWYTPNNATLTIAGDFDPAQAKAWVEKYFGEIARGAEAPRPAPRPVTLAASKSLMYEDAYARLPQLTMAWPTVGVAHPDAIALDALGTYLTDGRDAPLAKLLVDEAKVTDRVSMSGYDSEIAGEQLLSVRAFDGVDLDRVRAAIGEGLARVGRAGFEAQALNRVKLSLESQVYAQIGDVDGKAATIARLEAQTGDANFLDKQLAAIRALTPADLDRVFRRYILDKPYVAVSAVPKGKATLALADATPATLAIEPIVQGAEKAVDQTAGRTAVAKTTSRIDRSVEPAFGPAPAVVVPTVWQAKTANGLAVSGIVARELPVVQATLAIDGGQRLDDPAKPGTANLLARMMTRGTRTKTAAQLESAFQDLGARVTVRAERERILVGITGLARTFPQVVALVAEMLTQPRWDAGELALAKGSVIAQLGDQKANPAAIANRVTDVVSYASGTIPTQDILGTPASVPALTMAELQTAYAKLGPASARFRVAGDIDQAGTLAALAPLGSGWTTRAASIPPIPTANSVQQPRLYFYDIPDAKQSTLMFSGSGPQRSSPDYFPLLAANYILGGGGFASRLTQELREGKGYTYGIRSGLSYWKHDGRVFITSPVRTNVTLESAQLIRGIVADYPTTFSDADLATTKGYLTKSRAFQFEQLVDKLDMLALIGDYGLPLDYPQRDAATLARLDTAAIRSIAARYFDPARMTYVVVGDAKTQGSRLDALGIGKPIPANPLIE